MTMSGGPIRYPRPLTPEGLPEALLLDLIQENPVLRVVGPGGGPAWLVGGEAAAREVLSEPSRFTSVTDPGIDTRADTPALLVAMDPPAHTRLRKLAVRAFSARRVQELVPTIEKVVGGLLDDIEAAGPPVDIVDSLSFPLPLAVVGQILGLPQEDHDQLRKWSNVFMSVTAYAGDNVAVALDQMQAYIVALLEHRRRKLGADLISDLIRARDGRDVLTENELVGVVWLMILAGYETTVKAITRAVIAMNGTDTLHRVATGDLTAGQVAEEVLRHQSPNDTGLFRWAREDTELGGRQIKAGEQVFVSLHLANLDPHGRNNPAVFDPGRADSGHTSFGHGIHLCLGAALARAELKATIHGLALRMPDLWITVPAADLDWTVGAILNAPTSVPVRW